jgi:hypothetical protein
MLSGRILAAKVAADRIEQEQAYDSFAAFFRYVWRYPTPPHIRLLIECLQALEDGHFDRLIVIEPPGHAKSTVTTLAYPTWHIGRHPDHSIIGATTTGRLGEMFIDSIAEVIETDIRYRGVFPRVTPDRRRGWSREGLFVHRPYRPGQKDASIAFVGAGGPIIGRRSDLMLIDDAVDQPVARSELMLQQRVAWVRQSVRTRAKPDAKIVISGTVWAEADVIGEMRALGTFVTVVMRALSGSKQVFAELEVPDHIAWRPADAVEYDPDAVAAMTLTPGRVYVGGAVI